MHRKDLKSKNLHPCNYTKLFKITGELSVEDTKALQEYFSHFLHPTDTFNCVRCGSSLIGLLSGTFTWGLINGEGYCSECGYPARAYHRDVGPIKFLNMVLQYHPREFKTKREVNKDDK